MNRPTDLTEQNRDIERLVHELRVHQAELEVQNEELRRAEIELMASRDRYRVLYEQAPVGYARLDTLGRILDANFTLCQRLGCDRQWLVGRPLTSLMSEGDADKFYRHMRDVNTGTPHAMCEVGLSRGGGPSLQVRLDSTVTRGDGAEQNQVLTALVDVTDLRHAEDQARTHDAKAKILLDTTPDGIVTLDVDGCIEAVNAATLRMFGYDEDALLGRSVRMLLAQSSSARIDEYLATGGCDRDDTEPMFVQGRRKDGTEVPLEVGVGAWEDHGQSKLTVLLRDITKRRRTEQRLRESEARMREIAEHVDDVLYVRQHGGGLTYVSPAYDAIWGRPASTALDDPRGWIDFVDPSDQSILEEAHQRLGQGDPVDVEYRIVRPDGTIRWIRDHASPVRDPTGAMLRYVGVARDITNERRLEDELRQASKMDAINTLAAGIAHDFRNLLHGIAGCVAMAERRVDDPMHVRSHLGQIRDATRRGAALTDQLTNFSRRQDGDEVQPVVLDTLIEASAPLLMRLMGEQIRVVLQLNAPTATIDADPVQIERILMNLAGNASDAMPNGGTLVIRTQTVTVDESEPRAYGGGVTGRCVQLEVCDTGTGMDEATRERVFEPFFTTKEFGKGTGLGLAAVFGITTKLGGHVAVDSIPGIGTMFTFWLPRSHAVKRRESTGPHEIPLLSSTVLLVEDDPLVRMSIRSDLEGLGMHVIAAQGPRHALSLVDMLNPPPGLLITDVMMPDITGPRLADEISARVPGLRVLLVSAHSTEDLIARGTVRPGVPLLRKPFDKNELGRRVLEVLHGEAPSSSQSITPSSASSPSSPIMPIMPMSSSPMSNSPIMPIMSIMPSSSNVSSMSNMSNMSATAGSSATPAAGSAASMGTILLVDDDENGRTALAMLLEDEGMQVLAASDPAEALRMAATWPGTIELLLTDLNMPQMRGDVLARRIYALRRERIELLYLSGGFPPEDLDPKAPFILKPVAFDELVAKIRALCDRGAQGSAVGPS
jgi:two-component system cell cycle sensor histidine kinase/response regulator CckA